MKEQPVFRTFMSCLPELSSIREAQQLLAKYVPATPLVKASSLSGAAAVYLKIETGLPTGSFKPRGAMYALIKNLQRRQIDEVTASSTGNHGAATAFAARTLGVSATIFLPEGANPRTSPNSWLGLLSESIVQVDCSATSSLRH